MTIDDVIAFSKCKDTTFEQICSELYEAIDEYKSNSLNLHLDQLKSIAHSNKELYQSKCIDDLTTEIADKIQKDTSDFVDRYSSELTDQILDAINDKRIEQHVGYVFLSIVSSLKDLDTF
jgi:hypothetical protein